MVLAADCRPRTIIKKSQHEEMPVFRLFHEHSTVPVRVAADHTFLTNSGWKRAHELKINDEIYFILNGKYTTSKFCYLEGEEGLDTLTTSLSQETLRLSLTDV